MLTKDDQRWRLQREMDELYFRSETLVKGSGCRRHLDTEQRKRLGKIIAHFSGEVDTLLVSVGANGNIRLAFQDDGHEGEHRMTTADLAGEFAVESAVSWLEMERVRRLSRPFEEWEPGIEADSQEE